MHKLVIIIFILLYHSCEVNAEEQIKLSKQMIESFEAVSAQWGLLAQKHEEIGKHLQGLNLKSSDKASDYLNNSEAGDALKKALLDSSFTSVTQVLQFSKRFLGAQYYIETQINQSGVNFVDMVAILQSNIDRLDKEGADKITILKMHAQLAHHKQRAETIEYMLALLNDEDKIFIDQNLEWFKTKIARRLEQSKDG